MSKIEERYSDLFTEDSAPVYGEGHKEIMEWTCHRVRELCADTLYRIELHQINGGWKRLSFYWKATHDGKTLQYPYKSDFSDGKGINKRHDKFRNEMFHIIRIAQGFSKLVPGEIR